MAASAHDLIESLREQIRRIERRPATRAGCAATGRADVDALLPGGGFPRGALSHLVGGPASGKTGLALSALAAAMGSAGLGAFVDGRGELYPPAATACGADLARLLIVRPLDDADEGDRLRRALWAAEALLGSGAFEVVVMDVVADERLAGAPRCGSPHHVEALLRRLRAAAERGGAAGLWLGPDPGVRVPAAIRLELTPGGAPRLASVRATGIEVWARGAPGSDGAARVGCGHAA